jgi:hypothetical protein
LSNENRGEVGKKKERKGNKNPISLGVRVKVQCFVSKHFPRRQASYLLLKPIYYLNYERQSKQAAEHGWGLASRRAETD